MSLSKAQAAQFLARAAAPAAGTADPRELVRSVAVCDNHIRAGIAVPHVRDRAGLEGLAKVMHDAVRRHAGAAGEELASLTLDFIDDRGAVLHEASFGGTPGPPSDKAPTSAPPPGKEPAPRSTPAQPAQGRPLAGVRSIIAVGAGKGGVGKSTIAVNLAVGLARRGRAVGLLDGDIYGPSIPTMLGLGAVDQAVVGGRLQPFLAHGVKAVTIGKLVEPDKPLIWRGPMAHGAFKQLAEQTAWGELDYLVVDLPPGTGDVVLTMAQLLQLTGAIIVCTPQKVAQDDAIRATRMFQQLGIEVLGVVENMSFFAAEGKEYDLFGRGGAEHMAQRLGVPFLGMVPVTVDLRRNSDDGDPTANFTGRGESEPLHRCLENLVNNVEGQAALAAIRHGKSLPTLSISE